MSENILGGGLSRVANSKRYLIWFFVLNSLLAWMGAAAFESQAHQMMDHSLYADRLLHGFDVATFAEMLGRPEFGSSQAATMPGIYFAIAFFLLTVLFVPGVIQGYASTYRLPREEFFRACGRNLWRFVRLLIVAGIVMGIAAGALFAIQGALGTQAEKSTNELLAPQLRFGGLAVIFLMMTILRIWFDLAETDVVLSDQRAVRRSMAKGWRHAWRHLASLLGSYVFAALVGVLFLAAGVWVWMKMVPAPSVLGAVVVSQLTLFFLLIPRFWQRGIAVSFYLKHMVEPLAVTSFTSVVVETPVAVPAAEAVVAPMTATAELPPETQAS